jgi:hypothetical protein
MPKNIVLITVLFWALLSNLSAQVAPQTAVAPSSTSAPILEDGTPVKLRIGRTVSSADAHVGDTVDFEVLEEVKVGNLLIIPKGGTAIATVTEAQSKRRMARGGKLDINIDYVRLADGEKPALRAVKDVKGGGHTGAMTGAIVATSIVFFPAAPLFLFMHGKDITIPKGTEVTAYVNGTSPSIEPSSSPDRQQHPRQTWGLAPPLQTLKPSWKFLPRLSELTSAWTGVSWAKRHLRSVSRLASTRSRYSSLDTRHGSAR